MGYYRRLRVMPIVGFGKNVLCGRLASQKHPEKCGGGEGKGQIMEKHLRNGGWTHSSGGITGVPLKITTGRATSGNIMLNV